MKSKVNYAQLMLWAFCVIFFIYQYGVRSAVPNVLNEELRTYFSIHTSQLGSLISLFCLAYTLMQIPVGLIIDRLNAKLITVFAFSCVSFGTIIFVSTNSYIVAALSQIFLGFGCSFAFVLVMKITNNVFPKNKVAFFSSLGISLGSLGPVIMSPLLAYLSQLYYWKSVVLLFGGAGFLFSLLGCLLSTAQHVTELPDDNQKQKLSIFASVKASLSNRQCFMLGLFSLLMLGPIQALCDAWGISFIVSVYDLDKVHAASAISLVYIGTIIGGPIMAYIAEKCNSYKIVMIYGSIFLLVFYSTMVFIKLPLTVLYVWLLLIGISSTSHFLVFPAAMSMASHETEGTLTGVINTLTMLGGTILIPTVGCLLDLFKENNEYTAFSYKVGMAILVLAVVCATIIARFIQDRKIIENTEKAA